MSIAAVGVDALVAQDSDPFIDEIKAAFSVADASLLLALASEPVEIALLGESRNYSRSQAAHVLRNFFDEYKPRRIEVSDYTRIRRGWFIEGRLHLKKDGGPFHVYLRLGRYKGAWLLREMLIERPR